MTSSIDPPVTRGSLAARKSYLSSGKINWVRFIPWAALAWVSSAVLAVLLYFLYHWGFYFVVIVPLVVSLGVAGMVSLAVKKGHCRSRMVAGLLGLIAGITLYLGYYYVGMVGALGIESASHFDLLPRYIYFRMATDVVRDANAPDREKDKPEDEPKAGNSIMNWFIFTLEFGFVLAFACGAGIRRSSKSYCEQCQQWMNREVTLFKPEIGPGLVEALRIGSVQSLAALFTSPQKVGMPQTAAALDYCPSIKTGRSNHCPAYLSVKQVNGAVKGATLDPFESSKGKMLVRRILISTEELPALLPRFPFLETVTGTTAGDALKQLGVEIKQGGPVVTAEIKPVDPLLAGKVLTKKTALIGSSFIIFSLLLIFGSIGLAIFGGSMAYPDHPSAAGVSPAAKLSGQIFLGLGVALFLGNLVMILTAPDYFATRYITRLVRREFARRPGHLVDPKDPAARLVQIIPRANWGKLKLEDASDIGFLRVDKQRGEVLFEGDKEYYRIPAAAVTSCEVERFVSGEGTHGATTLYRLVLQANVPGGFWEAPIAPRGGVGKFRAKKREKWAREMRQAIQEIMQKT